MKDEGLEVKPNGAFYEVSKSKNPLSFVPADRLELG